MEYKYIKLESIKRPSLFKFPTFFNLEEVLEKQVTLMQKKYLSEILNPLSFTSIFVPSIKLQGTEINACFRNSKCSQSGGLLFLLSLCRVLIVHLLLLLEIVALCQLTSDTCELCHLGKGGVNFSALWSPDTWAGTILGKTNLMELQRGLKM